MAVSDDTTSSNLPPMTISLRNALQYCCRILSSLDDNEDSASTTVTNNSGTNSALSSSDIPSKLLLRLSNENKEDTIVACRVLLSEIQARRMEAYNQFWETPTPQVVSFSSQSDSTDNNNKNNSNATWEFKKQVIHRNIPCILHGLDHIYFHRVSQWWRRPCTTSHCCTTTQATNDDSTSTPIHISWFLKHIPTFQVPIHTSQPSMIFSTSTDSHGRAHECESYHATIHDWISNNLRRNSNLYLKDWHFAKQWESFTNTSIMEDHLCGYHVAPHFQRDLINPFLLRFTDDDYRFVYWGSSGSSTGLHSDVLNSFSWSYNVVGEKLWTFYPATGDSVVVQVVQHCGDCIFVPAGWRHTVHNTKETISINHNWISSCALDLMWQSIQSDNDAIQQELQAWGISIHSLDAEEKERMLSKSAGMKVSFFLLMILVEAVELIQHLLTHEFCSKEDDEETCFSLCSIAQVMALVMESTDDLLERLSATFMSTTLANSCLTSAKELFQIVDHVFLSPK